MSLSATILGNLIDSNLSGFGAIGSNRLIFSNAVAAGIILTLVGKSFTTSDSGSTSGSGTGAGIGLTGMNSSIMTSLAIATLPTTGVNASPLMQSIMNAVVSHLGSNATLTSSHSPVYSGSGTIIIGSIPITITEMSGNIDSQLSLAGAAGSNRTVLSTAIATGIVTQILTSATGIVTISGSGSGSSGSGSGTGVIS
jgi:hypothetical protein